MGYVWFFILVWMDGVFHAFNGYFFFFFSADFLFLRFPNIFILNFTAAKYFNEYLSGLISKVLDLKQ